MAAAGDGRFVGRFMMMVGDWLFLSGGNTGVRLTEEMGFANYT
jgi:hypothetical protein